MIPQILYLPGTGVVGRECGAAGFRVTGFGITFLLFSTIALFTGNVGVGSGDGTDSFLPGFDTTRVTKPSVLFNRLAACKMLHFKEKVFKNKFYYC